MLGRAVCSDDTREGAWMPWMTSWEKKTMTLRKSPCQERLELQFGGSYRLQTITVTGFRTRCYVDTNRQSTSNVSWGSDVVYAAILSLPYSFCFRISIPCLKTSRREQPAISHPPAGQRSCLKASHLAKLKRSHKGRSHFTRMGAQEWSKVEKKSPSFGHSVSLSTGGTIFFITYPNWQVQALWALNECEHCQKELG